MLTVSPCRVHRLDHPPGVTCTTIRRPHRAQYRGGSSSLAARHISCARPPAPVIGCPHRSQYAVSLTAAFLRCDGTNDDTRMS